MINHNCLLSYHENIVFCIGLWNKVAIHFWLLYISEKSQSELKESREENERICKEKDDRITELMLQLENMKTQCMKILDVSWENNHNRVHDL